MTQNISQAVMANRTTAKDELDDFPTPRWATRALLEHGLNKSAMVRLSCLEPACGRGYMAATLQEYFCDVAAADVADYGYGDRRDFVNPSIAIIANSFDWVITNPPFKLAETFINQSLRIARRGVAMLTRSVFIESVGRYERLFNVRPPTLYAQFAERVPMVKGRVDPKATTATSYAWLIWDKTEVCRHRLDWIPPCRKKLERPGDYGPVRADRQEMLRLAA